MFFGKMKALTFSYDDGCVQDPRLVGIFDNYGMQSAFNLNSGKFGRKSSRTIDDVTFDTSCLTFEEAAELYKNHEIASHTLTHPSLDKISIENAEREVREDADNLAKLAGYEIVGFAYPNGGINDAVVEMIKNKTTIKYARRNISTFSFEPPADLLRLGFTARHSDEEIFELAKAFVELKTDTPKIFSIFGHSWEFDAFRNWDRIERLCDILAGHDDIFYGTPGEVFLNI